MVSVLGQNLKRIREQKNISQRMLANQSGVANSAISRLESGTLNSLNGDNLKKISNALNVSIDELLRSEDEVTYSFDSVENAMEFILANKDLMLNGKPMTSAQADFLRNGLKNLFETAKLIK